MIRSSEIKEGDKVTDSRDACGMFYGPGIVISINGKIAQVEVPNHEYGLIPCQVAYLVKCG